MRFLPILLASFFFNQSYGNNLMPPRPCILAVSTDSLGIPISSHQFDSLVQGLLNRFRSDTSVANIENDLQLVKVYNTIGFNFLQDNKDIYNEYFILFNTKYLDRIVKVLNAKMTKGLSYYSRQYDLQIGGWKTRNNFYRIID